MPKAPKLEHVKFVHRKGRTYAYFNTGQKKSNGAAIYAPMPPFGSVGFYDTYATMLAHRTKRGTAAYTVAQMAREYEYSSTFKDLAKGSQDLYSITLRRISALLGEFPANDLERGDIQPVLDNEMSGPGAHNIFVAVLGALYKWGRDREKTTLEPTRGIKRLKIGEHDAWPEGLLEAGLTSEDDRIRLLVSLHYFTGQRVGDVCAMRWSDVRDGVINIVQEKTNKEMWIPVLTELATELARTPKRGIFILTDEAGRPIEPRTVLKELKAFAKAHGHKIVTHGLRKNAVNAFLEAECSVAEVGAITGQSYKMVEHYAKQINQKRMAKAAVVKLENKRGTGKRSGKPAPKTAGKADAT